MGVIIKYQVAFPDVGLTVSNDVYSGDFIIDASIKASMLRGVEGADFDITLQDLPEPKVKELTARLKQTVLGKVVINLGYFDGPFAPVMEGLYDRVACRVEGEKLVTSVKGFESGMHALVKNHTSYAKDVPTDVATIVTAVLKEAAISADVATLHESLPTVRFDQARLIDIIEALAQRTGSDFVVCDNTLRMGKPIIAPRTGPPLELSEAANLAVFRPFAKQLPEEREHRLDPLPATEATGFSFVIAGDPFLRPGQTVTAAVADYESVPGAEFRVHSVVHTWSTSEGYVCKGVALKVCTDANCRRVAETASRPSPQAIIASLTSRMQRQAGRGRVTEVAKVQLYQPGSAGDALKHRATLYTGQHFEPTETQPSARGEVDNDEAQLAHGAPIVSPFAWRKCGLVVPVYPGMRALLSHNLNLPEDGLVSGFLWSEDPALEPPQNNAGDWWLCLPIDFDASNPPADSTKAVNDLIANTGKRVIEAKGLKITIGTDKLGNVGTRPTEGGDDELLIEHTSGTKLTIESGGALKIEAQTVSIKGDVTIEGNVEIK
jgi:hypothetical protein